MTYQHLEMFMYTKREQQTIAKAIAIIESKWQTVPESFTRAEDASSFFLMHYTGEKNETFGMLMLNTQHQFLAFEKDIFKGTINSAAVYPRVLVQKMLKHNASAALLVHNHPSSVADPSQADIQITQRIKDAFALLDMVVLDHFVVGGKNTVSFAQRGLL